MATAFDVAHYILKKHGPMSAMKLQKLVYYSQVWSLVWDDSPIFENPIQAWANGPVVPDLYRVHRGEFQVDKDTFAAHAKGTLTDVQIDTTNLVLKFYGDKSMQWLSDQTHAEAPWKNARKGLADGERGRRVITQEAMAEYYSSLS